MSQTHDPKTHLLLDNDKSEGSSIQFAESPTVRHRVRRQKDRRTLIIVAIAIVVIASLLLAITLAITLSVSPAYGGENSNCITPDVCNSNILKYIDDKFDPCHDFYNYSCGNWLSDNPLNDHNERSMFGEVITDNYKYLSKYLASPIQNNDPVAIKKSKYIYSACMDATFIQGNLKQHLQDFIRNAGGWSDIGIVPDDGWNINSDLANDRYLGSSAFFSNHILPDDLNSSKPVIKVTFLCSKFLCAIVMFIGVEQNACYSIAYGLNMFDKSTVILSIQLPLTNKS